MAGITHTMAYRISITLINTSRTTGLLDKLDVWMAIDRLTTDEYIELTGMLTE